MLNSYEMRPLIRYTFFVFLCFACSAYAAEAQRPRIGEARLVWAEPLAEGELLTAFGRTLRHETLPGQTKPLAPAEAQAKIRQYAPAIFEEPQEGANCLAAWYAVRKVQHLDLRPSIDSGQPLPDPE